MQESLARFLCAPEGVTSMWHNQDGGAGTPPSHPTLPSLQHFLRGCKIALCEYPPFPWHLPSCMLRDRSACGTKPGHPHSTGSTGTFRSFSPCSSQSSEPGVYVEAGGQLGPHLLCHPPAAPCGTTAGRKTGTAESPVLMWLPCTSCWGAQLLLVWRGAQVRHEGTASLKSFATIHKSLLFGNIKPSCCL